MAGQSATALCARLVVTGCLAERYREELRREIPENDAVAGHRVSRPDSRRPGVRGRGPMRGIGDWRRSSSTERSGFLNPRCRFPASSRCSGGLDLQPAGVAPDPCTTPRRPVLTTPGQLCVCEDRRVLLLYLRLLHHPDTARRVSQPDSRIHSAGARLADRGVRELLLISQDHVLGTTAAIAARFHGSSRTEYDRGLTGSRLLYLYPTPSPRRARAMAECEKVCRYIDLPLQLRPFRAEADAPPRNRKTMAPFSTGSDAGSGRTLRPDSDRGFPRGETEGGFAEPRWLCRRNRVRSLVGVFTYSHKEGTARFDLATTCRR